MLNLLTYLIAILIMLPFISTIFLYFTAKKKWGNSLRAFHFSINYSTIFYILAVWAVAATIFNTSFLPEIFILLLVMMSISVLIQWKARGEIKMNKAWKGFWRASFLVFGFLYSSFLAFGIIKNLFF